MFRSIYLSEVETRRCVQQIYDAIAEGRLRGASPWKRQSRQSIVPELHVVIELGCAAPQIVGLGDSIVIDGEHMLQLALLPYIVEN